MSTVIGRRMIDGSGVKYHTTGATGNGIMRKVAGTVLEKVGEIALRKAVSMVKGEGFKIAGEGKKRKQGRPRKVGRPKKKKC